jgi:pyrroloquinoline quinone biosynthesis protein D
VSPCLAPHALYRWDALRREHQIVHPEGVLVLNWAAAAVVRRCDGRPIADLIDALELRYQGVSAGEVRSLIADLVERGLVRDAGA